MSERRTASLVQSCCVIVSHEPPGYRCPFCKLAADDETSLSSQRDIVRRTEGAFALIAPRWKPNNLGHVLVVTQSHHENLYELPSAAGHAVHDLTREIALAMKATYGCDGVSTRQHNEPAGNQSEWHYHVHVFPRYHGDDMYRTRSLPGAATPADRAVFADRFRSYFAASPEAIGEDLSARSTQAR